MREARSILLRDIDRQLQLFHRLIELVLPGQAACEVVVQGGMFRVRLKQFTKYLLRLGPFLFAHEPAGIGTLLLSFAAKPLGRGVSAARPTEVPVNV